MLEAIIILWWYVQLVVETAVERRFFTLNGEATATQLGETALTGMGTHGI